MLSCINEMHPSKNEKSEFTSDITVMTKAARFHTLFACGATKFKCIPQK